MTAVDYRATVPSPGELLLADLTSLAQSAPQLHAVVEHLAAVLDPHPVVPPAPGEAVLMCRGCRTAVDADDLVWWPNPHGSLHAMVIGCSQCEAARHTPIEGPDAQQVTLAAARRHLGAAVVYRPHGHAPREQGVIRRVNDVNVFVAYDWQRADAAPIATPAGLLRFGRLPEVADRG